MPRPPSVVGDMSPDPAPQRAPTSPTPTDAPSDLAWGAFSDRGPWVLDPDAIPWQWEIDRLRRGTRRKCRGCSRRRCRSGRSSGWSAPSPAIGGAARRLGCCSSTAAPARVPASHGGSATRSSDLGSSYVKLGQIISGGEGLFPDELVREFKLLRDQVAPEPFEAVRAVVEVDLGGSLESLFAEFSEEPIAAASIAQVHAARLVTGEEVVVKVQRPQVAELFRDDIAALSWLTPQPGRPHPGQRARRTRRRWSSCSPRR